MLNKVFPNGFRVIAASALDPFLPRRTEAWAFIALGPTGEYVVSTTTPEADSWGQGHYYMGTEFHEAVRKYNEYL